jgi:hypothetical protein
VIWLCAGTRSAVKIDNISYLASLGHFDQWPTAQLAPGDHDLTIWLLPLPQRRSRQGQR